MSKRMKQEREMTGKSAKEVAKDIGVHENALLRWENDEANPLASNLVKLAKYYGCSVEYLLGYTDERDGKAVAIA